MNNKNKAFTLAEVLITLGIIGIVASITIPTLVNNYQKKTYVTNLKKFYTIANQALHLMIEDYGCVNDLACTGLLQPPGDANSVSDFNEAYVKYFKTVKICGTQSGCWATETNNNYDGSGASSSVDADVSCYKFITADGMSVSLDPMIRAWKSSGRTGNMKQYYGLIVVDVNGVKGPNAAGRDTFEFYLTNGKGALLYPQGGADVFDWWSSAKGIIRYCYYPDGLNGWRCAGRVMEEGWEMNY